MKRILYLVASGALLLPVAACNNSKLAEAQEENQQLDDSLHVALENADSLFSILYDVTTGMEQITRLEHLLQGSIDSESPTARQTIQEQMNVIQRGLMERRQRIEELEKQLAGSKGASAKLRRQIAQLREQINNQAATVASLHEQLEAANFHIAQLDSTITDLHSTVDTITGQRDRTRKELDKAVDDLNAVYYVIGTKEELRSHNIIEGGGFLKKTKVLPSDFDRSYMTRADRRTLTRLPLDSSKAKVLTTQPSDSYTITTAGNGMKTLEITDASKFWGVSNIIVIQTN
jgi:seryl-tRNA synthetase